MNRFFFNKTMAHSPTDENSLLRAIPKTRRRVFDFVKRDDLYERCCGKSAIFAFCGKFARFSAFLPSQTALIMPSGHGIPLVF